MNWLRDTWREVTSGGKAKTETYNRAPEPPRPAASGSRSSRGGAVPVAPVQPPARPAPAAAPAARPAPAAAPARQARPVQPFQMPTLQRQTLRAPEVPKVERPAPARETEQRPKDEEPKVGFMATVGLHQAGLPPAVGLTPKAPKTPAQKLEERRQEAKAAAAVPQNREWQQATTRELSHDEYLALSPRQRAAVEFNTGLTAASAADRQAGGDANTRAFLSDLSMLDGTTDVDAFLKLDRAIGDAVLSKLEDKTTRQQSAESLRLAQGMPGAAPRSRRFSDAMNQAGGAADAMALKISNGVASLRPGTTQGPGFSESLRDTVLRTAYEAMVNPAYNETAETMAEGLAELNGINGTDVTPQELWDFTRRQVDAVDFGAVRGKGGGTVAVTDPSITPLSVEDIRARYGL